MIALAGARPSARAGLLLTGLAAAMTLRLALAGAASWTTVGAAAFAVLVGVLAGAAGWRPGRPGVAGVLLGAAGGAALLIAPLVLRLAGAPSAGAPPLGGLAVWAVVVSAIAVAEELLLRGALFDTVDAAAGPAFAVAVAAVAFALLHVPLYGWGVVPIDLAVGVWLGGLRLASGGVAAPATAHVVADLATWWLR